MKYKCPFCGEIMTEEESESCGDIGCTSCRRTFDWEDYEDNIEDDRQKLHDYLFGNE